MISPPRSTCSIVIPRAESDVDTLGVQIEVGCPAAQRDRRRVLEEQQRIADFTRLPAGDEGALLFQSVCVSDRCGPAR